MTNNSQAKLKQAPQDQLEALKSDPRLYIRNLWRHPNANRQYDFRTTDGEQQLHYLTDDEGPLNPDVWGGINIFLMARGLLKTTTLQMIVNWALQFYGPKGFEGYMAAPRDDQTTEFVEKLKEKVAWTGLTDYREKNALGHQKFKFPATDGARYAHFKADSGWGGGDAMRGPHSHLGIFDEFQDATPKAFNAGFYEVIDQSLQGVPYFPAIFVMGTPKMEGSFFEEMWERSDQREWVPTEDENGAWIPQDDPEVYGPEGTEQAMEVRGWHIDQPTAPIHSEAQIQAKRDLKDEQEFKNEVLAEFFSPEDHLLAERHIDAVTDPEMAFVSDPRPEADWVSLGIDWGGGDDKNAADTVLVVMEHQEHEDGVVESIVDDVNFLDESLSKDEEFEELEKSIIRFGPDVVVVDEGYASKRREDLQQGNHTMRTEGYDIVKGCRFGNISAVDKVKWKNADQKRLFTADKTHMAKSFVDFVKSERLRLPSANITTGAHGRDDAVGTRIYRQLTAPYEERKTTKSGRKKSSVVADNSQNDDAFDAFLYAWMGYHVDMVGPTNSTVEFRTLDAPGV